MGSARTVEVRQIEQPEDLPGKVIAEVSSDGITPESTAELEIGLEWEGEPTELYFGNTTPRNCRNGAVNRTTGWPPGNHTYERKDDEPECWRPNLARDDDFGHPLGLFVVEVDRGETLSCRAEVWGDHKSERCLSPGNYTFRDTISEGEGDFDSWSFEIHVKRCD